MFCSKCGKTLTPSDQQCPHCGIPIGESRFAGTPYTSAQPHILPNTSVKQATAAYARTNYTSMNTEEKERGDVDSRTTYRPVYEGGSSPEEVRRDMRTAMTPEEPAEPEQNGSGENLSEEALSTLSAVDEELKMENMDTSDLRSRPIASTGRAGISAGVEDYIQRLEASQNRRAARRRRNYEEDVDETYSTPEDQVVYDDLKQGEEEAEGGQNEVFEDIGDEEFEDMRYGRTLGLKDILKVALIMVVAAALIIGGVLWFRHIRGNSSSAKIEGVTETLYTEGIDLIKSRTEDAYISELASTYSSEGAIGLATRVSRDSDDIDALLPAEPAVNDPLFVSALQTIQSNIGNAVLMDASAASGQAGGGEEDSAARWAIVNNAIAQLENATTAAELTSILNGEQVTVAVEATPTPEPVVTYNSLQKGDKSDEVLEMQNRLYLLGWMESDRDGDFGSKTQTAVKMFQSAAGLEVTGIADNGTLTLLYSDDAPMSEKAKITPTPDPALNAEEEVIYNEDEAEGGN